MGHGTFCCRHLIGYAGGPTLISAFRVTCSWRRRSRWSSIKALPFPFGFSEPFRLRSRTGDQIREVTAFLEKHTGEGSVIALKLNSPKNSRVSAIVQFTRKEDAQDLTVMTQQKSLSYDRFHLRARDVERDIIAKPRKPSFVLENVILLLGCPLSHKRLSVLWSAEDVKVSFGLEVRNIFFSLTHEGRSYELEVAHESIREIHLHRSLPQRPKFLVIQVGSPTNYFPLFVLP
ncbi:hypothetical protein BHM03_00042861 [Ensete ventricosum]|nr:hypothetical protein BHM03_00042861 [Ensete ventricosum]